MAQIDRTALASAPWPMIAEMAEVTGSWRQLHHAAQAASEAGKAWAAPREDDGHSAFRWDAGRGRLLGARIDGARPFRAGLELDPLAVVIVPEAEGAERRMLLEGRTLAAATAWVRGEAEAMTGAGPRQEARPAPDLPDHPVASGDDFGGGEAFARVREIYAAGAHLLGALAEGLDDRPEIMVWPHHFDMAVLHVVSRDATGGIAATIGVGVTPPDLIESSGYIYVSAWRRDGSVDPSGIAPALRWEGSMAVLPLAMLAEPHARGRIAGGVADALAACRAALGDG